MPQIYLCFLWHMHQPFYKDLITGQYKLPWTRMHGLKDYYGMVRILRDFPRVRQTFNLVPSLIVQLEEYASGQAADPFLACAAKPAEDLTGEEQEFILQYFFQANVERLIRRYPRYGQLYDALRQTQRDLSRARSLFNAQAFRDLQVLSQLAWFDEEFLATDPELRALVAKQRDYSLEDQAFVIAKEREILARILPVYREFAARGQIEISTTPFYHPILPLLCDTAIAAVAHPNIPLPSRFRFPQDARVQLERARQFMAERFGTPPAGLWPSEGSVSDEALALAAEVGFRWAASDDGVLARTLGGFEPTAALRPYRWHRQGRQITLVFRHHFLSDLIGFVYSRMDPAAAAADFLGRVHETCRPMLAKGRDALLAVILDGENAWEYYERNGRPFLSELYRRISEDEQICAVTVAEAVARLEPEPLEHIHPGSWINANFDVWIGSEEDNLAWEYLLRARETLERVEAEAPEGGPKHAQLAREEILIAEGSDWCWWYGPEHTSANRAEFDQLYRTHLANAYRALGVPPPEELSRPILRLPPLELHLPPTGPVHAVIDGEVTSFFEWLGAGLWKADPRSEAMHGQRRLIREVYYGADSDNFYLRVDFDVPPPRMPKLELRIRLEAGQPAQRSVVRARWQQPEAAVAEADLARGGSFECVWRRVLELRLPLAGVGADAGETLRVQISLWQDGLPMDALPAQGWIECSTAPPAEWPL
ncbi:MAG: glycoside hydrolase family 57 protein [Bryobacterales bacterium]|nr:glycoside hydrolase family 57 protein [Bryobacteraceae bacterium]MDW8353362.1 glycoside hydrolase family 57 protein [Bryobacterales bacterium]